MKHQLPSSLLMMMALALWWAGIWTLYFWRPSVPATVAEANASVRGASEVMANAEAVLHNANNIIDVDPRGAVLHLRLEHASQNLMVCLGDGRRERCAISTEWREALDRLPGLPEVVRAR